MATITKALTGIMFNAASLVLAGAPWKNNVRAIYGFNAAGNGYTLFKPTSNFNSLTQLVQDGVYIVDAATPGFELPDALLAVPPAGSAGVLLSNVSTSFDGASGNYFSIMFTAASLDPADMEVLVAIDNQYFTPRRLPLNTPTGFYLTNYPLGSVVNLFGVTQSGASFARRFPVTV